MKQSKKTKKMLISGVVSLVLCLAMLVGSTLAWFTDTINVTADMQVGTFKVALQKYIDDEYQNIGTKEGDTTYTQSDEPVFGGTNWTPGRMEASYLAVANKGTMPLDYDMLVDVSGDLVGALEYAIIDGVEAGSNEAQALEAALGDWDKVKTAAAGQTGDVAEGEIKAAPNGHLEIGETDYFALVIYMKEEADNSYQGKSFTADVVLNARQVGYVEEVQEPDAPVEYFTDYVVKKAYDFEDENFAFEGWNAAGVYNGIWAYNTTKNDGTITVEAEGENHYTKIERIYTAANRPSSYPGEMRIRAYSIQEPVANEKVILYSFDIKQFESGVSMQFDRYLKLEGSAIYHAANGEDEPVVIADLADGKWHNIAMEIDVENNKVTYYGDGEVKAEAEGLGLTALPYYEMVTTIYGFPATAENDKVGDISVGIDNIKVMVPKKDPFANYTVKKAYDFENNFAFSGWKPAGQETGVIPNNGGGGTYTVEADGENHYVKLERIYTDATRPSSFAGDLRIRAYEFQAPVANENVIAYSFDIAQFVKGVSAYMNSGLKLVGDVIYHAASASAEPVAIVDLSDGKWHNVVTEIDVANNKVTYYGDGEVKAEVEGLGMTALPYYEIGLTIYNFPATPEEDKTGDISIGIDNVKVMVPPATE